MLTNFWNILSRQHNECQIPAYENVGSHCISKCKKSAKKEKLEDKPSIFSLITFHKSCTMTIEYAIRYKSTHMVMPYNSINYIIFSSSKLQMYGKTIIFLKCINTSQDLLNCEVS